MITREISGILSCPDCYSATGKLCFYCGEAVQNPAIMWHGNDDRNTDIYFHPDCVIQWTVGIWRDALELRYPSLPPRRRPKK